MTALISHSFPQREKQNVEDALRDVRRNEEEMCQSNQSLLSRLEDVQVRGPRLQFKPPLLSPHLSSHLTEQTG